MAISVSTVTVTASLTSGNATVTTSSTTGVVVGQYVYGPGVRPNTTVSSFVANTSITLSQTANVTLSGQTLTLANTTMTQTSNSTQADLAAIATNYPGLVNYIAGACIINGRIAMGGFTLTITDGTNLVFNNSSTSCLAGSGTVVMNGAGLTYNGPLNTPFGYNTVAYQFTNQNYRVNLNTGNTYNRTDHFCTSGQVLTNCNIILGGGGTGTNTSTNLGSASAFVTLTNCSLINAVTVAGATWTVQAGQQTVTGLTFPSPTSTQGVTANVQIYLSRSAGQTTTLRAPVFPGTSYALAFDLPTGTSTTSKLVNEVWPDNGGTPGTLTRGSTNGGGSQIHRRIYEWSPGTYFTEGGWNVRLRDSQATPVVVQNGVVTASTALEMEWQRVSATMTTMTPTNYGPFKLLARKPGYAGRYETFTPTAARTESFLPVVDSTYTSDQSGLTGISANNSTNTITISAGTKTLDQIYDWFQWWLAQSAQMAAYPDVATIGTVSGTNWTFPTGWTLVVNSGVTVTEGTKLTYIYVPTVTNNGSIQCVYGTTAGVSTQLDFQLVSNNGAACIWDYTTGTTELYALNTTGSAKTYTLYYPPGSAGTQKNVARELYGYQREGETITLAAGKMWVTYTNIPDVGITEASQSTVAAYTTAETSEKQYDYLAYKRLDSAWIKLGQIGTREGTAINWGSYSGVIKSTNAAVLSLSGSTLYWKANGLTGTTKFDTYIATPPATWEADTTEIIDIDLEDGNGDSSITISASGVSTFEIWKITDATDPDDYATGTLVDTVGVGKWRFLHDDGYKFVVRDTTTNYRVVVEAEKGNYDAELFFGAAVQLAQAPDVTIIKNNLALMQIDVDAIKGTGFDSTDSLHAISDAIDALPATILASEVETGATVVESLRLHNSVLGGIVSGAGTGTEVFRDLADTKDRLISSVDSSGNRTAETKDLT